VLAVDLADRLPVPKSRMSRPTLAAVSGRGGLPLARCTTMVALGQLGVAAAMVEMQVRVDHVVDLARARSMACSCPLTSSPAV